MRTFYIGIENDTADFLTILGKLLYKQELIQCDVTTTNIAKAIHHITTCYINNCCPESEVTEGDE